jgi:hypothetical protein
MAADRGRRITLIVLLVVLLLPLVVAALPGTPGSVRVAGVSLLWWYAAVAGPLAAALTVMVAGPLAAALTVIASAAARSRTAPRS